MFIFITLKGLKKERVGISQESDTDTDTTIIYDSINDNTTVDNSSDCEVSITEQKKLFVYKHFINNTSAQQNELPVHQRGGLESPPTVHVNHIGSYKCHSSLGGCGEVLHCRPEDIYVAVTPKQNTKGTVTVLTPDVASANTTVASRITTSTTAAFTASHDDG